MYNVIGTCGSCGGQVMTPNLWGGVIPPIPSCAQCGREAASHGPVIPMKNKPLDCRGVNFELMGLGKTEINQSKVSEI